jgi:hypothetical protein
MNRVKLRIISSFDALSQWINVTFFPRVQDTTPNESVSGRSYREGVRNRVLMIDTPFLIYEKEHCRKSFEKDYVRALEFVENNKELYENPITYSWQDKR